MSTPNEQGRRGSARTIVSRTEFAARLTDLRETGGLSVREVARRSGIATSTLGGWFSGRHVPPLTMPEAFRALLVALEVTEPAEQEEWVEALRRVRRAPGPRPSSADLVGPYRGLAAYEPDDAEWFFGREDLVAQLRGRVDAGGVTVVVGVSGAGKSSVLRAGLVAQLRADGVPFALLTPGEHPLENLERALGPGARVLVVDQFEELFTLTTDEEERQAFLARLETVDGPVVLGLRADFYARVLAYPWLQRAAQAGQLVVGPMTEAQLRRAVLGPATKAGVEVEPALLEVLVRDLPPEPAALPLLSHALLAMWSRSGHGDQRLEHYRAVGGVTHAIAVTADEVFDALDEEHREIARRMFLRLVTVPEEGAATRRRAALSELDQLGDDEGPAAVRERFVTARLVTAGDGTLELAHEALVSEWPRLAGWIAADRDGLRQQRVLTEAAQEWERAGRDPELLARGGRLELAAALVEERTPTRLERDFVDASVARRDSEARVARRGTLRLRRLAIALAVTLVATSALAGYAFHLRDTTAVERDAALSRQLALEARQVGGSDGTLASLLSLAAYRISPTRQAYSQLLDSAAQPRSTRLVGDQVAMQGLAVHRLDDGGLLVAGFGEKGSGRLWHLDDDRRVLGVTPLPSGDPEGVRYAAAFSPDARWLAVAGSGGTVQLWDMGDPDRPRTRVTLRVPKPDGAAADAPAPTVFALAWDVKGAFLAAGDSGGGVNVWSSAGFARRATDGPSAGGATGDLDEGRHRLSAAEGEVHAVAFSPGGYGLFAGYALPADASGAASGAVFRWPVQPENPVTAERFGPPRRLSGDFDAVLGLAVSPDARHVAATTRGGKVVRWTMHDARADSEGKPLDGPATWVNGAAYSPYDPNGPRGHGPLLAAAGSDSKIWLWNTTFEGGAAPFGTLTLPSPVTAVAFADDRTLVSASTDGVARVWDVPTPSPAGLSQTVFGTAWTAGLPDAVGPAGAPRLAAGGRNQVGIWDVSDPRRPWPLVAAQSDPDPARRFTGAIAWRPDGRVLASGNDGGGVRLYDTGEAAGLLDQLVPLPSLDGTSLVEWLAFRPDGKVLVQVGDDGVVRLWNLTDVEHPVQYSVAGPAVNGGALGAAFSRDGRLLAVCGLNGVVRLWDVQDPGHPKLLSDALPGPTTTVVSVQFSPDGRTLAAAGYDRVVHQWDVSDPAHVRPLGKPLSGPTNIVYALAYSPDGHTLAAGSNDGTVWWWDVTRPARAVARATLTGGPSSVFSIGFSPDGAYLSAGGLDGRVTTWPTDADAVARTVCASAGTPLSSTEWAQYAPGTPYEAPCG
ncbi:helix-turn-helix domain-containing protein [Spongisporangium articulatum]|uniref:Helix-turn-helix domain-containing protein n=1 Tax=Spongisporangium articulatum TaxID=3362603 RepID=A0ABW8ATC0_9ACTN